MKIITVVNQKGGVGKSTITCHIVFAAREAGKRILVVDMDTQGNTSEVLTRDPEISDRRGGAEQLFEKPLSEIVPSEPEPGVFLLHGHTHLQVVDAEPDIMERALAMRTEIRAMDYDYILFDTPPSIGPRHVAPMFWSDLILVPVIPSPLSMSGLPKLTKTLKGVRKANPSVDVKYVVNMIMGSSKQQKHYVEAMRDKFGGLITAELPHRVAVADALDLGEPVWKHGPRQTRDTWRKFVGRVLELKI